MEVKRSILGGHPSAQITHIPDMCIQSRTIVVNKMKVLTIFKDRRPTAVKWIDENIPRLLLMDDVKVRRFLAWFWNEMPDNGWLEFDFGKKTLSLCILEKK